MARVVAGATKEQDRWVSGDRDSNGTLASNEMEKQPLPTARWAPCKCLGYPPHATNLPRVRAYHNDLDLSPSTPPHATHAFMHAHRLVLLVLDECHRAVGNAAPVAALHVSPGPPCALCPLPYPSAALLLSSTQSLHTTKHQHQHQPLTATLLHVPCTSMTLLHHLQPNSFSRAQALRRERLRFRLVGLSATPGSNPDSIAEVIRNLAASRVEFRGEEDPDVAPYCHTKQVGVQPQSGKG